MTVWPSGEGSSSSVAPDTAARAPSVMPPRTNSDSKPPSAATARTFTTSATAPRYPGGAASMRKPPAARAASAQRPMRSPAGPPRRSAR